MPNRDKRLRGLIVEWISGVLTNFISIRSLLRYENAETFENPRDIPDVGYVNYQISQIPSGSGGITTQNKTEADLLEFGGTGSGTWYLPVMLGATDLVLAVSSTVTGTKKQIQFSVQDGKIFGFESNDTQSIIVKIG